MFLQIPTALRSPENAKTVEILGKPYPKGFVYNLEQSYYLHAQKRHLRIFKMKQIY